MVKKVFILTLFFFTHALCAPSVTLDLSGIRFLKDNGEMKPTVFLGETFTLKATTIGGRESVRIKGLEQFITRGKNRSSNISVNNSKMLIEQTIDYTLSPKKEGSFVIGPATTRIDGKEIESNKVIVHAQRPTERVRNSLGEKKTIDDSTAPYNIICELTTNKQSAFVEEPVIVTLSLYHRGSGYNIRAISPPKFENCTVKDDKKLSKTTQFKKDRNGVTYSVIQKNFLVFPTKPGLLTISPAKAIYNVRGEQSGKPKRGIGFFDDDFFSNFFSNQTEQRVERSNALTINVKKLPTDTITSIGTFSKFTAHCNKSKVNINEPITLTLELEGQANFDLIASPEPSLPDIFKSYDSKSEFFSGDILGYGTKKFSFILQIPEQGTWTIPKQTFSYFDTKDKKVKTLYTTPITLVITLPHGYRPTPAQKTPRSFTSQPKKVVPQKDISFIEEQAPATRNKEFALSFWLLLVIILLVPSIFYADAFSSPIQKLFLNIRTNNFDITQKRIIDAIEFNEFEKLYSIFIIFIAKQKNIQQHEVTHEKIATLLSQASVDHAERFCKFLKECAQYSFTSTPPQNIEALQQHALDWLNFLNKNI